MTSTAKQLNLLLSFSCALALNESNCLHLRGFQNFPYNSKIANCNDVIGQRVHADESRVVQGWVAMVTPISAGK
jgi:hypothetical protein